MIPSRCWLGLSLLAILPLFAAAQTKRDAHVIYKDGYVIKGKVEEQVRDTIYDPASGRPFIIPSGNFHIDDYVRRIYFPPTNVQEVFQLKPGTVKPPMKIVRFDKIRQELKIGASFRFDSIPRWDEKGKRIVQVFNTATNRPIEIEQRIGIISPSYVTVASTDYEWNLVYFTQEFGPELTRKIVLQIMSEKKEYRALKEQEKFLLVAQFMHEAGWHKEAEGELTRLIGAYPNDKRTAEELLTKLKADRANAFVKDLEQRVKVGQHLVAMDRLDAYDRLDYKEIVTPDNRLKVVDLKARYEKAKSDIEQARTYLKAFATILKQTPVWTKAAEFMAADLHLDTIDRLETFVQFAQQYEMDVKANRKPGQKAEEVMAIAVSGWLQGPKAAEPDVKHGLKLAEARAFILDYLRNENQFKRSNVFSTFKRDNDLPADVIGRLIQMMPPSHAHDAKLLDTNIQTIKIDLTDSEGGSYLVQLPPDYNHLRAYPVLMLLHSGREKKAEDMLVRFTDEAAKHGLILVAPLWAGNKVVRAKAQGSAAEHALVLDTLRDLRRRFQVDSDRVYMFGWEDGANLAFDVGLGHPDQFAGVAPMNGTLQPFTRRFYWPNAQYLPFYVIEGDRNGANAKAMKELYKEWTRPPYTCLYVEYKGRGSEWFGMEVEKSLDWLTRKRRHMPLKELGRANFGGALGEEFHSSRSADNRFYWLKCEGINDKHQADHRNKWFTSYQPATFQGNLSVGNEKDNKSGAKIWNQANLRVTGTRQFTFMITPAMMNLEHPFALVVNGQKVGGLRNLQPSVETLLEELYQTGDRQRLFVAKIDIKM